MKATKCKAMNSLFLLTSEGRQVIKLADAAEYIGTSSQSLEYNIKIGRLDMVRAESVTITINEGDIFTISDDRIFLVVNEKFRNFRKAFLEKKKAIRAKKLALKNENKEM
ncbi:MAG: hypothetical protein ACRC78_18335 [Planktothrix sp.]